MKQAIFCMVAVVLAGKAATVSAQGTAYTQYTNLPTLYIETASGLDPEDKENYLPCKITMIDGANVTTYDIVKDGIRGRGNSTWSAMKRPWRLKFDSKVAFLGKEFAKAKSWTLLANAYDKSLMRNALTYHLGKFLGMEFCPAARHVDLVLNGSYRGTYQISDQMEVREKRVPVDEDTGWLLEYANAEDKVDDPKVPLNWNGEYYGNVEIKNPEFAGDDLGSNPALAGEISNYLNNVVGSRINPQVKGYDYIDPVKGYRSLVDTLSLINWYVATEITANWDGFYSIYSYREGADTPDAKLHLGPMWDEDLAYGNHTETTTYFYDFYDKLLADCNFNRWQFPGGYRKMQPVVRHLWDDPWFANAVTQRLNNLLTDGIQGYLEGKVDEMKRDMAQSAARNFQRWSISDDDRGYATPENCYSWDYSVSNLRNFIGKRLAMMKQQFARLNAANLYLDEAVDNRAEIEAGRAAVNVVLRRAATAGKWTTCCLPFDLPASLVTYYFGAGAKVAEFKDVVTAGTRTELVFASVPEMKAGVPYVVCPDKEIDVPYAFLDMQVGGAAQTVVNGGCSFTGSFAPAVLSADGTVRILADGVVRQPAAEAAMQGGYRAWFVLPPTVADNEVVVTVDGVATGIDHITTDGKPADGKVYTIDGRQVGNSLDGKPRGIYIRNGNKVIK